MFGSHHPIGGANAFHFGDEVDLRLDLALSLIGDDRLVMSNLDPRLFIGGSPREIERLVREFLAKAMTTERFTGQH